MRNINIGHCQCYLLNSTMPNKLILDVNEYPFISGTDYTYINLTSKVEVTIRGEILC